MFGNGDPEVRQVDICLIGGDYGNRSKHSFILSLIVLESSLLSLHQTVHFQNYDSYFFLSLKSLYCHFCLQLSKLRNRKIKQLVQQSNTTTRILALTTIDL